MNDPSLSDAEKERAARYIHALYRHVTEKNTTTTADALVETYARDIHPVLEKAGVDPFAVMLQADGGADFSAGYLKASQKIWGDEEYSGTLFTPLGLRKMITEMRKDRAARRSIGSASLVDIQISLDKMIEEAATLKKSGDARKNFLLIPAFEKICDTLYTYLDSVQIPGRRAYPNEDQESLTDFLRSTERPPLPERALNILEVPDVEHALYNLSAALAVQKTKADERDQKIFLSWLTNEYSASKPFTTMSVEEAHKAFDDTLRRKKVGDQQRVLIMDAIDDRIRGLGLDPGLPPRH